jgi:hypothetical protein
MLRSNLLVEENGVHGENHQLAVSHLQTLSHNVVSSIPRLGGICLYIGMLIVYMSIYRYANHVYIYI